MTQGFWNGRSVFVTGGTGLLGGWLVKALLEQQADVVLLVRDDAPGSLLAQEGLLPSLRAVHGSLQDFPLMRRTMSEYSVDTVFHLAAQAIVGTAKVDPLSTLEINVQGTWNMLEAARLIGVKQVVVASSDKAYGDAPNLPYRESYPLQGRYPYDVSKSCADLISTMYAETYKVPVAIARCANLFGGGDLNFSRVIPDAIRSTLAGRPFVIRSDGKFIRDFIYVKDGATAYLHLAERLAEKPELAGEAFNFSMEVRSTILEIVQRILVLMGRPDLTPVIQNQASHEIREQFLTCEKARSLLGWAPGYGLDDALRETIAWYEGYLGGQVRTAPQMAVSNR